MTGAAEYFGTPSGVALKARSNPNFWYDSDVERQTDYPGEAGAIAEAAGTRSTGQSRRRYTSGTRPSLRRWTGVAPLVPGEPAGAVVIPYMGLGGSGPRVEIAFKLLAGPPISRSRALRPRACLLVSVTSLKRSRPGTSSSSRPWRL